MKLASLRVWAVACALFGALPLARTAPAQPTDEIYIVEAQGTIEIWPVGANRWILTGTNQSLTAGDRLRTGRNSRVGLRWSDQSFATFGAETEMEVVPPHKPDARFGVNLIKGLLSFFHRDKPNRIQVITRGAIAGVDGTEFMVNVEPIGDTEETTLFVIDGIVRLGNERDTLVLTNGQAAAARPGQAPVLIAGFVANNIIQWALYYPAVLDPAELPLTKDKANALAKSLEAYEQGDLLAALREYPEDRKPTSDAERIYHAALVINVGQIDQAAAELKGVRGEEVAPLAETLRQMIAAVKHEEFSPGHPPALASELLAASYYEQSRATADVSLQSALRLARQAVAKSPEFGFAWARVAELEFSFGRVKAARNAVEKALELTPRNAQAIALQGFLHLAENRPREALEWFDKAIAADSALANAWLGRGLARIRTRQSKAGEEDLLIAAALEPQRSLLRSYLGKAHREPAAAERELELAIKLDPNDPTPWLYSALIKAENNRINEAIRDLERSKELNDNRMLYRSRLLLDQDRSVRSANLASIYRDAGMQDWSVFEAGSAVSADYANYSAHLFLANSYDELRDPNRINLRYETPAEVEYLIANLLAPASAGVLSYATSQREYYRLLEGDRAGISSQTEYLSRGAWLERGAHFGVDGNTAYSFEAVYRSDRGQRVNNDLEHMDLRLHLKQQLSAIDTVYAQVGYYNTDSGDLRQYPDQAFANTGVRIEQEKKPELVLGYHREWYPGMHTLAIAGRLHDRISVDNPSQIALYANPGLNYLEAFPIRQSYRSELEIYFGELQQIWERAYHTTIVGARVQGGDFDTRNFQIDPRTVNAPLIVPDQQTPAADQHFTTDFERFSAYGYHTWEIASPLTLIAGLSYDRITFPENFRAAPILDETEASDQISPKAGLIWAPGSNTIVRAAYTRSLGGASIDQSMQLEPSHVAGLLQSFRSILPESVSGAEAGAEFETTGLTFQQKLPTATYLAIGGQVLRSDIDRTFGVFEFVPLGHAYTNIDSLRDRLEYTEQSLIVSVQQLLGEAFAFGARYRLTEADLDQTFPEVRENPANNLPRRQHLDVTLHEVNLHLLFNSPTGVWSRFEATWREQHNRGYAIGFQEDPFWQLNLFAGYRFLQRRAEIQIGLLNITDQDYELNPLTLYQELPRDRTLALRVQFAF